MNKKNKEYDFRNQQAPKLQRNISISVSKPRQDEESGSVELVFTTERPVQRARLNDDWDIEYFKEILSMDPSHVRTSRLEAGAVPFLDSHRHRDLEDQIGTIVDARFENEKLIGSYKPRTNEKSKEIHRDILNGSIRNTSIGYIVYKYLDISEDDDKIKTLKAIDWEPFEVSAVPIGADLDAGSRNFNPEIQKENKNCELGARKEEQFKGEGIMPPVEENVVPAEPLATAEEVNQKLEEATKRAKADEKKRISEIEDLCARHGMTPEFTKTQVTNDSSIEDVREMVLEEVAQKSQKEEIMNQTIEVQTEDSEKFRAGIQNAIEFRVNPGKNELNENGRRFHSRSALEIARLYIEKKGKSTEGMTKDALVRSAMTTSDLPNIFANVMNKELLNEFTERGSSYDHMVDRVSHSDFKPVAKLRLGDAPELKKMNEEGEITYGKLGETKESFGLDTFARGLKIGRRAFINDDLSALSKVPRSWARKVRQLEHNLVWALITSNPVMGDGITLFHADHNNLNTGSTAISVATVGAMENLLMDQKDLDGELISLEATHMMVPSNRKVEAAQFLNSSFVPTKASDVNPFRGNLEAVWEARLKADSTTNYYLTADKTQVDMIQLATLDGRGPEIAQEGDFDTDGIKMRIIYDVTAGLVDWRGFTKTQA